MWLACFRCSDSGVRREVRERKKIRRKRGREEGPPTPPLTVFPSHISLRCPYNLNAWNRRVVCRKKSSYDYKSVFKLIRFAPHERANELNKNGYFFSNIVIPCVSAWWGRALPFWWWIFILGCQPHKLRDRWYMGCSRDSAWCCKPLWNMHPLDQQSSTSLWRNDLQ